MKYVIRDRQGNEKKMRGCDMSRAEALEALRELNGRTKPSVYGPHYSVKPKHDSNSDYW